MVDASFLDIFGHPAPLSLHYAGEQKDPTGIHRGLDPVSEEGGDDLSAAFWRGGPNGETPSDLGVGQWVPKVQVEEREIR